MTSRGDVRRPSSDTGARRPIGWLLTAVFLAVLAVLALVGLSLLFRLVTAITNPFGTDTVDRSGPVVLQALEDLSEYRAATGHFQVVLDVEESARFLPPALRGQRTLFVAVGSVDATVDLGALGDEAIEVSDDRTRVAIRLPRARLSEARVDLEESYVYERRRGLIDRIGELFSDSPDGERELYLLAQERLTDAARDTDLLQAAERNTRSMLEGMLRSLGFTDIEVAFR